jgi:hypothetical protein
MLLKLKDTRQFFSIGLLWAIETRKGIEKIKSINDSLSYGLVLDLPEKEQKSVGELKLIALTNAAHKNSISLAGALSKMYANLIYVHQINEVIFWVCIICDHQVWANYDVVRATAGDYIGALNTVRNIITEAEKDFAAKGIDTKDCCQCSETAAEMFPQYQVNALTGICRQAVKYKNEFTVRYIEAPHAAMSRIIKYSVFLIVLVWIAWLVLHRRAEVNQVTQGRSQQEMMELQKIQERKSYFAKLMQQLNEQDGSRMIAAALTNLEALPMQSNGWKIVAAEFNHQHINQLTLSLIRTKYGTLYSFKDAYQAITISSSLGTDYNHGTKVVQLMPGKNYSAVLKKIDENNLTLADKHVNDVIAYQQANVTELDIKLEPRIAEQYGVQTANFSLAGNNLWELRKKQFLFKRFETLIIETISFAITESNITWILKGKIYA